MLTHWSYVFLALTPRKSVRMISAGYRSNCELTKQSVPLWRVTCISGNNEHVIKRFNCTYKYILKVSHEYCNLYNILSSIPIWSNTSTCCATFNIGKACVNSNIWTKGNSFQASSLKCFDPCLRSFTLGRHGCLSVHPPAHFSVSFLCRGCCHSMNFLLVTYWSNDPVGLDWIQPDQTYQHQSSE